MNKTTYSNQDNKSFKNWSISSYTKNSIELIKNNPKILLLSILMMIFSNTGGGSFNSNISSPSRETSPQLESTNEISSLIFENASQEDSVPNNLGLISDTYHIENNLNEDDQLTGSQDFDQFVQILNSLGVRTTQDELEHLFSQGAIVVKNLGGAFTSGINRLPSWVKIVIPLQLLVIGLAGLIFGVLVGVWAETSMLFGIQKAFYAEHKDDWKLIAAIKDAYHKLLAMLWMTYVPAIKIFLWLVAGITSIIIVTATSTALLSKHNLLAALITISIVIGVIIWLIQKILRIVVAQILGKWILIDTESIKANEAFAQATHLVKQKGAIGKALATGFFHLIIFGLLLPLLASLPLITSIMAFAQNAVPQITSQIETQTLEKLPEYIEIVKQSISSSDLISLAFGLVFTSFLLLLLMLVTIPIKNTNWWQTYLFLSSSRSNTNQHSSVSAADNTKK